jgi:hypothetical protein
VGGAEEVAMPAEVVGRNIGQGRLNRWLLKIIGPASIGSPPRSVTGAEPTEQGSIRSDAAQPAS